jgi:hypothetical protein
VAHDAGPDLDQLELEVAQSPVGFYLGQLDAAQEGDQVVGQRVQMGEFITIRLALALTSLA